MRESGWGFPHSGNPVYQELALESACLPQPKPITIRALGASEWEVFKDFRLHALKIAPGVFASSYDDAMTRSPEEWQLLVSGPTHQVFGLFELSRLIGITAVFASREDPSGQTAMLAMSFLSSEYRGRGLSRLFYEARLDWIRMRPQFKRVVVSHRASNEASRRANRKFGFVETGRGPRVWPDGTMEDEIFYELWVST
jgi:RimJ/RimL family protein N-acetyltransferase